MLSHRLIHNVSLGGRSHCIHCMHTIAWYDLVPVFSWIALKGVCRSCKKPISRLYPFIELLTLTVFMCMVIYIPVSYWVGYSIFFSALIVTIRSDLDCMLISRIATLFLIPVGILLSLWPALPITAPESILGACIGYCFLWVIATLFAYCMGKEGMGQGDLDLLAFIGAFTGPCGCWVSILIGSIAGSLIGLCYLAAVRPLHSIKIPFGPFLAFGALVFVFLKQPLLCFLLGS